MQRRKLALAGVALAGAIALALAVHGMAVAQAPAAAKADKTKVEKRGSKRSERAVAVEAAIARGARTTTDIRAIGSLRSDESVQIASEIAGLIEQINFTEGGMVNAGDVLIKLDDDLAEAQVTDAKARYTLAAANDKRAKQLSASGFATEKAFDEAATRFEIAQATLALERMRLAKHVIRAPFSGVVGLRKVSPGSFVAVGTPIVNLEKIDMLKVDFKLPEQFLSSVSVGQTVDILVDAHPGRTFIGEIYAIDPQLDVNGRALALRARLSNADMALRPGLFARVLVKGKQTREVVLAPESAIVPRGGENYVFRIDAGKAIETKVQIGERHGAEIEILEGVLPNSQIVTAGQIRLRNGSPVDIVETTPDPKAAKPGTDKDRT
ncbi:MAG TPA: efflux RND transporter periplasmic adaptor subunit [Hyphomicrobiaceae bacterium]|nr:efflux RND transporter periplasmic adaptor subunit [Hyphomicrobiaceae bacterium]